MHDQDDFCFFLEMDSEIDSNSKELKTKTTTNSLASRGPIPLPRRNSFTTRPRSKSHDCSSYISEPENMLGVIALNCPSPSSFITRRRNLFLPSPSRRNSSFVSIDDQTSKFCLQGASIQDIGPKTFKEKNKLTPYINDKLILPTQGRSISSSQDALIYSKLEEDVFQPHSQTESEKLDKSPPSSHRDATLSKSLNVASIASSRKKRIPALQRKISILMEIPVFESSKRRLKNIRSSSVCDFYPFEGNNLDLNSPDPFIQRSSQSWDPSNLKYSAHMSKEQKVLEIRLAALMDELLPGIIRKLALAVKSELVNSCSSPVCIQKIGSKRIAGVVHETLFGDVSDLRKEVNEEGLAVKPEEFLEALKEYSDCFSGGSGEHPSGIGLYKDFSLTHQLIFGDKAMLQNVLRVVRQEISSQISRYMKLLIREIGRLRRLECVPPARKPIPEPTRAQVWESNLGTSPQSLRGYNPTYHDFRRPQSGLFNLDPNDRCQSRFEIAFRKSSLDLGTASDLNGF